jgi:hypothetical protein
VDDHQLYQLDAACLLWRLGDGSPPPPDPIYSHRASSAGYAHTAPPVNTFFQRFYRDSAAALAALEAREHTAQVVTSDERECNIQRYLECSNNRPKPELERYGELLPSPRPRVSQVTAACRTGHHWPP